MSNRGLGKILIGILLLVMAGAGVKYTQKNTSPALSGAQVTFLDVGQGDSALFRTEGGKYVLVDGGPDKKVLSELGEVLPAGVHRIDAIILSHPHADHVAGLDYVIDRYEVSDVYLTGSIHGAPEYLEFLDKVKKKNIPAHKAYNGQTLSVDDMSFDFLYPLVDVSGQKPKDQNDNSLAFRVKIYGSNILMLGDLSAKLQEKNLLANFTVPKIDILKVSHHGSKTGTTPKTIEAIDPNYSVISVGSDNDFGHPAPSVLTMLSRSKVFRTDQAGRVIFKVDQDGVSLQ